jgi:hypothetical protein
MQERRSARRFDLKLPCLICVAEDESAEEILRLETLNISTDGAYFATRTPLPNATRMSIEVVVQRPDEADDCRDGSCISLYGQVVRANDAGMAIRFDQQYQINRITRLIARSRVKTSWMEMLAGNDRPAAVSLGRQAAPGRARPMRDTTPVSVAGHPQLLPV